MAKFNNKKNDISSKFKVNDEIRFRGEVTKLSVVGS